MKILIIENDLGQRPPLVAGIKSRFDGCEVEELNYEKEFLDYIGSATGDELPDVIVLDVWMPFFDRPSSQGEIDEWKNKAANEAKQAGLRCAKAAIEKGMNIPIILYSIFKRDDVIEESQSVEELQQVIQRVVDEDDTGVVFLAKSQEIAPLLDLIERLVK